MTETGVFRVVEIAKAGELWPSLLEALEKGEEIHLMEGGQVKAKVIPSSNQEKKRVAGLHLGNAVVAADFDAPLPDALWGVEG